MLKKFYDMCNWGLVNFNNPIKDESVYCLIALAISTTKPLLLFFVGLIECKTFSQNIQRFCGATGLYSVLFTANHLSCPVCLFFAASY